MARSSYVYVLRRSDSDATCGAWTVKRELGEFLRDLRDHGNDLIPYYIVRVRDGRKFREEPSGAVFVSVNEVIAHAGN